MINKKLESILIQLPEVQAGKGVLQNEFHDFDVYNHSLNCADCLKKMKPCPDINMIVAGYLHDIGKPVIYKLKKQGKAIKKNHGEIGEEMVEKMDVLLFEKYGLDQKKIARLVGAHCLPINNIIKMRKALNYNQFVELYNKFLDKLNQTGLDKKDIMTLFFADSLSKKKKKDIYFKESNLVINAVLNNNIGLEKIYSLQKKIHEAEK